jgi:hypothetical protein
MQYSHYNYLFSRVYENASMSGIIIYANYIFLVDNYLETFVSYTEQSRYKACQ